MRTLKKEYDTGNLVLQYQYFDLLPPKHITVGRRKVRSVYSKVPLHFQSEKLRHAFSLVESTRGRSSAAVDFARTTSDAHPRQVKPSNNSYADKAKPKATTTTNPNQPKNETKQTKNESTTTTKTSTPNPNNETNSKPTATDESEKKQTTNEPPSKKLTNPTEQTKPSTEPESPKRKRKLPKRKDDKDTKVICNNHLMLEYLQKLNTSGADPSIQSQSPVTDKLNEYVSKFDAIEDEDGSIIIKYGTYELAKHLLAVTYYQLVALILICKFESKIEARHVCPNVANYLDFETCSATSDVKSTIVSILERAIENRVKGVTSLNDTEFNKWCHANIPDVKQYAV